MPTMDKQVQTTADTNESIPHDDAYFPGIAQVEEVILSDHQLCVLVRCDFSHDFSTQTEQSDDFNAAVEQAIAYEDME
jgi:hypothetical protein